MILKVMRSARPFARFTKHLKLKSESLEAISSNISKPNESDNVDSDQSHSKYHGIPKFTKVDNLDAKLTSLLASVKSRKGREKHNRILLEGKRLISDAVEAGAILETVLFSRVDGLRNIPIVEGEVQVYKIPYKMISLWSDTSTCPGIMAILRTPEVHLKQASKYALPLTVICDNVRDPGNLGAILRVVAGVGCKQLLITKGCVDLWEPKVLRSAAGAHFRIPIHKNIQLHMLDNFIDSKSTVFLADNDALTKDISGPTNRPFDRLISLLPYYDVDFSQLGPLVLVVGGETEGLSNDAMQLAGETQGARLHIPLMNGVESLNTATALSVILFEIKRQLMVKNNLHHKEVTESQMQASNYDRATLPNG